MSRNINGVTTSVDRPDQVAVTKKNKREKDPHQRDRVLGEKKIFFLTFFFFFFELARLLA